MATDKGKHAIATKPERERQWFGIAWIVAYWLAYMACVYFSNAGGIAGAGDVFVLLLALSAPLVCLGLVFAYYRTGRFMAYGTLAASTFLLANSIQALAGHQTETADWLSAFALIVLFTGSLLALFAAWHGTLD